MIGIKVLSMSHRVGVSPVFEGGDVTVCCWAGFISGTAPVGLSRCCSSVGVFPIISPKFGLLPFRSSFDSSVLFSFSMID